MNLVISFAGWCVMRLATDPDPTDEPRGVSGYTFAFAGEPDLDRVLHMQPPTNFTPRSHSPQPLGVTVSSAQRSDGQNVPALGGGTVELLDEPRLENRNWVLTLPGFEPLVPFHLQITGDGVTIRRDTPLNPEAPDQPVWEVPAEALAAQGANGINYEPETVGHATGIWDSMAIVTERLAALRAERRAEQDPVKATALDGRIAELEIAVASEGNDRRVGARYFVERFAFPVEGETKIEDPAKALGGTIDETSPWTIGFWMGAWDPDVLCLYMQGALEIPYASA
jgi:hypothetical protein